MMMVKDGSLSVGEAIAKIKGEKKTRPPPPAPKRKGKEGSKKPENKAEATDLEAGQIDKPFAAPKKRPKKTCVLL